MKYLISIFCTLFVYNSVYEGPVPKSVINTNHIDCIASNIYHEARGESFAGKKAVAFVTINRAKSGKFPSDICDVVKQPGQFSWVTVSSNFKKAPKEFKQLAYDILMGKYNDNTFGSLYFHNLDVDGFNRKQKTQIGNHIFY